MAQEPRAPATSQTNPVSTFGISVDASGLIWEYKGAFGTTCIGKVGSGVPTTQEKPKTYEG